MLRLAHSSDWHVPEGRRFGDVSSAIDFIVDDGIQQGVQLWANTGDFAGTVVPYRQPIATRNYIASIIQRQAEIGPVINLYGNHDHPGDLDVFARLKGTHPIHVVAHPEIVDLPEVNAAAYCLPFPHKRDWLEGTEGGIEEQNVTIERRLAGLFDLWREHATAARATGKVTLFLAHAAFRNCVLAGGEIMLGQEIMLNVEDVLRLGCEYNGSGHIHLAQEMAANVWHAGSPSRSNFGETDAKGFLIVDVEPGQPARVHRRLTPVRPFITIAATWAEQPTGGHAWHSDRADWLEPGALKGAEVRVLVTVGEDAVATCPFAELEAMLLHEAGAHEVKLDKRTLPRQRTRLAALAEDGGDGEAIVAEYRAMTSLADRLKMFWRTRGASAPSEEQQARCIQKLAELETA